MKQLFKNFIWLLPGGRAPWQESEPTSRATDCRQAQAHTRAAQVKNSGRGATVIERGCGRRRTTPAASSRRMSLDFFMSSTRSVPGWSACHSLTWNFIYCIFPFLSDIPLILHHNLLSYLLLFFEQRNCP